MLNFNQTTNKADNEVIINGFSFGFLTDKDTERLITIIKGMQNGTEIKASKPTTTAKAVEKKPAKEEPKSYATTYNLELKADGIHILKENHKIGSRSWNIACSKLFNADPKNEGRVQRNKDYGYYIVGKGGKMSATETKKMFETLGGKIEVLDEDYGKRA